MAGKTIELTANAHEQTEFIRIWITKIAEPCSECGHVRVRKPYGQIFLPKVLGMPEKILITVKGKEILITVRRKE